METNMTKLLMTSAAALILTVGGASAASWGQDAYGNPLSVPAFSQQTPSNSIAARPRVYFGTGYSGAGTATGGPVGGLPNRN